MRLLTWSARDELSLTEDLYDNIPLYTILSHTWVSESEEVTFTDLQQGRGRGKAGYAKILFCGERARKDGIEHFWVDTCCIEKENQTKLAEAITSMFRWYQNAVKCYVYLSDVSASKRSSDSNIRYPWELSFRTSRWFTRGWTLQELLAPKMVEFFSREGELLGTKETLVRHIHEITTIPVAALHGTPLSQFSVAERMRWAEKRQTKMKEDKAYCLLGIFQASMPLIYGEGDHAFIRLKNETVKRFWEQDDELLDDELEDDELRGAQLVDIDEPLRYHPLSNLGFRLLKIDPGTRDSKIVGQIQEFSLSHPPAYYALSYAWGQEAAIHRISINDCVKDIQPNLFRALQQIRSQKGQYHIWVDHLCIDQSNDLEKSNQVRQMATIYNRANGVLVWLGDADLTSKVALDFVPEIISSKFQWDSSWWENHRFTALAKILSRSWFRRGWVLQEAAFSKLTTIICGDQQVFMNYFIMAIDLVRAKINALPPSSTKILQMTALASFYDSPAVRLLDIVESAFDGIGNRDISFRKMSLEHLVNLSNYTETTDQRDTIYALLSLASDIPPSLTLHDFETIVPDYGKTVLDTYADFILHCSCRSGTLDVICRPWAPFSCSSLPVIATDSRISQHLQTFPSWIASRDNLPFGNPAWGSKHRLNGNPFIDRGGKRAYSAHCETKPQVYIGRNKDGACDGTLHAKGILLGQIARRSTRMANAIIAKDCLELLRMSTRKLHSSLTSLPDAIWRSLCGDRNEKGEHAPRVYRTAMVQLLHISSEKLELCDTTSLISDVPSIDIEEILETEIPDLVKDFLVVVRDVIWNRRTFCSKIQDGSDVPFVGVVPRDAKVGDQICLLYGCSVPVILRKLTESAGQPCYKLIGDAYVHGIMDGEAIKHASRDTLQSRETVFKIL